MIEYNYIPNLPLIPFRYGSYEGIVMHATAVYGDTALNQRDYESTHYNEAFVHAFSDKLSTLEIASTNHVAYGAGHVANLRYLHSELCQVKNDGTQQATDDFKASYCNWIDYAAQRLFDRKLDVIPATPDGKGTVWQHYDVTKYLGGSNHTDPMDYLNTWSVTWEQVISDIQNKYKELEKMEEVLARLTALEKECEKAAAPEWFVKEFGSGNLNGLIDTPTKTKEFWETLAVVLRAVKYVA